MCAVLWDLHAGCLWRHFCKDNVYYEEFYTDKFELKIFNTPIMVEKKMLLIKYKKYIYFLDRL